MFGFWRSGCLKSLRISAFYCTRRSCTTKEKNIIVFWHNWFANQLTFIPFLMNVFFIVMLYVNRSVFLFCPNTFRCMISMVQARNKGGRRGDKDDRPERQLERGHKTNTVNVRIPDVRFGKPDKKASGFRRVRLSDVRLLPICPDFRHSTKRPITGQCCPVIRR